MARRLRSADRRIKARAEERLSAEKCSAPARVAMQKNKAEETAEATTKRYTLARATVQKKRADGVISAGATVQKKRKAVISARATVQKKRADSVISRSSVPVKSLQGKRRESPTEANRRRELARMRKEGETKEGRTIRFQKSKERIRKRREQETEDKSEQRLQAERERAKRRKERRKSEETSEHPQTKKERMNGGLKQNESLLPAEKVKNEVVTDSTPPVPIEVFVQDTTSTDDIPAQQPEIVVLDSDDSSKVNNAEPEVQILPIPSTTTSPPSLDASCVVLGCGRSSKFERRKAESLKGRSKVKKIEASKTCVFPLMDTSMVLWNTLLDKEVDTEKAALDEKLQQVLNMSPKEFVEWLMSKRLILPLPICYQHVTAVPYKLKLVKSTTRSEGYEVVSQCCGWEKLSVYGKSIFGSLSMVQVSSKTMIYLIYHWACQNSIKDVETIVKVKKRNINKLYWTMRCVASIMLTERSCEFGIDGTVVELDVVSLDTNNTDDDNGQAVQVIIVGLYDHLTKALRLFAMEPFPEDIPLYHKIRYILQPLKHFVDTDATILVNHNAYTEFLKVLGYKKVSVRTSSSDKESSFTMAAYLQQHVPRLLQSALHQLTIQQVQLVLDELCWREHYGNCAAHAFNNMIEHISSLTTREANNLGLLYLLELVAKKPQDSWNCNTQMPATRTRGNPPLCPLPTESPTREVVWVLGELSSSAPNPMVLGQMERYRKERERRERLSLRRSAPHRKRKGTPFTRDDEKLQRDNREVETDEESAERLKKEKERAIKRRDEENDKERAERLQKEFERTRGREEETDEDRAEGLEHARDRSRRMREEADEERAERLNGEQEKSRQAKKEETAREKVEFLHKGPERERKREGNKDGSIHIKWTDTTRLTISDFAQIMNKFPITKTEA